MAKSNAVSAVTGEIFREGWSKVRGSMQGLGQKRPQMVRAAKGHRAAVFKPVRSGGCQTKKELSNQLEYLTTKSSHIVDSRGVLDGKRQLNADEIKGVVDRFSGRWSEGFRPKMGHTTHMLMSYPVSTKGEDVRDISAGVCERFFANDERNFDYIIAIHEDRDHPHAHIVINRRSQEGEYFYLGRDHHFNYDDFRTAMVEEAEKVGVRLEATKRVDRGDTTYAPRTKEIYDAKKENREPVPRERVGRDLDRALAEIAIASKLFRSLAAEASAENREDISNALFRAGEILATGGQLEQNGEIYMANQESFDDLRGRFADRAERVEQFVRDAPDSMKARYEKQLDAIYRNVAHMQPMGVRSQTLNDAPSDTGIYSETNINKDNVGVMKEPETRAQIETALRGTGISSSAIIARVEQGASNASLEQRWIADDLSKIAKEDGLNLERQEDLAVAAQKLDEAHVRLGETLEHAEVLHDDGIVFSDDQERPSDAEFAIQMENAAIEDYRDNVSEEIRAEAGAAMAENEGIQRAEREEALSDSQLETVSFEDRQELEKMERAFARTDFNYGYSDNSADREAGKVEVERASEQFQAYADKSPAHAALASEAWDKSTDIMRPPEGFVAKEDRVDVQLDEATAYRNANPDIPVAEKILPTTRSGDTFITYDAAGKYDDAINDKFGEEPQTKAEFEAAIAAKYPDMPNELKNNLADDYSKFREASPEIIAKEQARQDEYHTHLEAQGVKPYEAGILDKPVAETSDEIRRVIEHERTEKIDGPFDVAGSRELFRGEVERELSDEQVNALKEGDADAFDQVIDDRLDRLYAAKAYLQSDEATANSDATREVISEINDEEYDAQRLKHVLANTEKGQTHG